MPELQNTTKKGFLCGWASIYRYIIEWFGEIFDEVMVRVQTYNMFLCAQCYVSGTRQIDETCTCCLS